MGNSLNGWFQKRSLAQESVVLTNKSKIAMRTRILQARYINWKLLAFAIFSFLISAAICFIGLEIVIRIMGAEPFRYQDTNRESKIMEEDPVLGWKNKPGVYTKWPNGWSGGKNIKVTIWPDGQRATAPLRIKKDKQIIIIGCSFMQGWALNDNETFAWKLQENFPETEILNYGTGGYGTYQSLLLLERYLANSYEPPIMVLYGLGSFHLDRNVAAIHFLKKLTILGKRGHVFLPYCSINGKGILRRNSPLKYPLYPLDEYSAPFNLLHTRYLTMMSHSRVSRRVDVMKKLLLEMNILCRNKGSRLVVLLLDEKIFNGKKEYFSSNNIDYIDCSIPENMALDLKVKGEGHPSSVVNSYWASCVTKYLKKEFFAN
jgi:hypothetical protein